MNDDYASDDLNNSETVVMAALPRYGCVAEYAVDHLKAGRRSSWQRCYATVSSRAASDDLILSETVGMAALPHYSFDVEHAPRRSHKQ